MALVPAGMANAQGAVLNQPLPPWFAFPFSDPVGPTVIPDAPLLVSTMVIPAYQVPPGEEFEDSEYELEANIYIDITGAPPNPNTQFAVYFIDNTQVPFNPQRDGWSVHFVSPFNNYPYQTPLFPVVVTRAVGKEIGLQLFRAPGDTAVYTVLPQTPVRVARID